MQQRPAHRREALRAPVPGRPRGDARAEQHPVEPRRRLLRQPDERAARASRPHHGYSQSSGREVDAEPRVRRHACLYRLEHGPQLRPANRLGVGAAEVPDATRLRHVVRRARPRALRGRDHHDGGLHPAAPEHGRRERKRQRGRRDRGSGRRRGSSGCRARARRRRAASASASAPCMRSVRRSAHATRKPSESGTSRRKPSGPSADESSLAAVLVSYVNSNVPFVVDEGGFGGMCKSLERPLRRAGDVRRQTARAARSPRDRRGGSRCGRCSTPFRRTSRAVAATTPACAFPCGRPVSTMFCT